jgi:hypothetical protein
MKVIKDDTVGVIGVHQMRGQHEAMIDHAVLSAGDQVGDQMLDKVLSKIFGELWPVLEEIGRFLNLITHLGNIVKGNKAFCIIKMGVERSRETVNPSVFRVVCCPSSDTIASAGIDLEILFATFVRIDISTKVAKVGRCTLWGVLRPIG